MPYLMKRFQSDLQEFQRLAFGGKEETIRAAKKGLEEAAETFCAVKDSRADGEIALEACDSIIAAAVVLDGLGFDIGQVLEARVEYIIERAPEQRKRDQARGI